MKNSTRVYRTAFLTISSAAATIALLSGCSSDNKGADSSTTATTDAGTAPATTAPSVAPGTSAVPPSASEAPAATGAPDAGGTAGSGTGSSGGAGPSRTETGGNSAAPTTVKTPSPPTGDDLPGQNSGPSGRPGTPGGDN